MATKYYCDGCDKELQSGFVYRTSVSVQVSGQVKQAGGEYELCRSCMDQMIRETNPRQWTRCGPAPKAVAR